MATPEGRVKAKLKKRLNAEFGKNCYVFMPVQNGFGAATLDYLLCVHGLFVSIETKRPGGVPTPRQETTIETIRAAGGLVFVVDGEKSLDDAVNTIKRVLAGGAGE